MEGTARRNDQSREGHALKIRITKEYEVAPEVAEEIADAMLEWLDSKGWRPVWSCTEKPEPRADDGDELSYREMAEMFVREREDL